MCKEIINISHIAAWHEVRHVLKPPQLFCRRQWVRPVLLHRPSHIRFCPLGTVLGPHIPHAPSFFLGAQTLVGGAPIWTWAQAGVQTSLQAYRCPLLSHTPPDHQRASAWRADVKPRVLTLVLKCHCHYSNSSLQEE